MKKVWGYQLSKHLHLVIGNYWSLSRVMITLFLLSGCVSNKVPVSVERTALSQNNIYVLDFDHHGRLVNPEEVERARDEIQKKYIDNKRVNAKGQKVPRNILVLSLGWNYDRDGIRKQYATLITQYVAYIKSLINSKEIELDIDFFEKDWDVFIVSWDSSERGVRRLMNDLLPMPAINELVSWGPDKLLFPFSFWSKAALADRIGYGDLRNTMENVLLGEFGTKDERKPTYKTGVFLIGHSLGCRILGGMINQKMGDSSTNGERYKYLVKRIKGVLLIEPAAIELNLPKGSSFPTIVTQTRHDHANGFLYPVVNLPLNAYTFSRMETIKSHTSEEVPKQENYFENLGKDLLIIPASFGCSLIAIPTGYIYNQGYQIWHRHLNYPMDTLAQIPLLEIPVDLLDEVLEHGEPNKPERWGSSHRGLMGSGLFGESAARAVSPDFGNWRTPNVVNLEDIIRDDKWQRNALPNGFLYADCSKVMSHGFFDLNNHLVDWTVGWLDPVGAHGDYKQPPIYKLIYKLFSCPVD
jgi:hypothetical protein